MRNMIIPALAALAFGVSCGGDERSVAEMSETELAECADDRECQQRIARCFSDDACRDRLMKNVWARAVAEAFGESETTPSTTEDGEDPNAEFLERARDLQSDIQNEIPCCDETVYDYLSNVGDNSWDVLSRAVDDGVVDSEEFGAAALALAQLKAEFDQGLRKN